ncbi:MAG: hypothetical protein ACFNJM_02150 [Selenomonas artemidis]
MDRDTSDRMRCISLAVYMAVSFYFAFDLIFLAVYTLIVCDKGGAYGVGVAVPAILVIVPFVPIVKEIPWRRLCLAAGGGFFLLYGMALLLVELEFLEDRLLEVTLFVGAYIVIQLLALLLLRYFCADMEKPGRYIAIGVSVAVFWGIWGLFYYLGGTPVLSNWFFRGAA